MPDSRPQSARKQQAFTMRFEPVVQSLVWQTQNRCGGRNALAGTDQSFCFKLEFQRVLRPVCLSHNTSHEQDYASRYGIHFTGARSVNRRFGRGVVRMSSQDAGEKWGTRQERKSPADTTCWDEVPLTG
jgi:hypothetical protein